MYNMFDIASLFPDARCVLLPPREGERLVGAMPDTTTTEKLGWSPKVELDEWVKKKIKL
jgi:GDP-D-mannose dehydratase